MESAMILIWNLEHDTQWYSTIPELNSGIRLSTTLSQYHYGKLRGTRTESTVGCSKTII